MCRQYGSDVVERHVAENLARIKANPMDEMLSMHALAEAGLRRCSPAKGLLGVLEHMARMEDQDVARQRCA